MEILRVAVWGLGRHAIKNVIPALKNCPGINFYGVCSRNNESVSKIVLESGCMGWTDPEEMLKDSHVDVVYLSTPIALHYPHGRKVLLAAKHLWCEKPLTENLAQASELVELATIMNVSIGECFMYLYHPQFLRLQEIISSEKLGVIKSINCRFGIPALEQPGFRYKPELGGSGFLDVGCYPVSAIISLFPGQEAEVLFAQIKKAPGFPVDTEGRAILGIDNIDIMLDWSILRSYRNEIDIWGTLGSVSTIRIFSKPASYLPYFIFTDLHGKEQREACAGADHFLEMFKVFLENITDDKKLSREKERILQQAELMNKIQNC